MDGDNGIRAKKRLQVLLKALLEYSAVASLEPDLVIMHENDSLELFHLVVFHVDRLRIVRNLATGDLVEGHGQGLRIGGTGDFPRAMEFLCKNPASADKLISHYYPIGEAAQAFATARVPEGTMKVVLTL